MRKRNLHLIILFLFHSYWPFECSLSLTGNISMGERDNFRGKFNVLKILFLGGIFEIFIHEK